MCQTRNLVAWGSDGKLEVLLAWVGLTDLRAPTEEGEIGSGPIAQAVEAGRYDEVVLLSDHPKAQVDPYVRWLAARSGCPIKVEQRKLSGPTQFWEIYQAAREVLERVVGRHPEGEEIEGGHVEGVDDRPRGVRDIDRRLVAPDASGPEELIRRYDPREVSDAADDPSPRPHGLTGERRSPRLSGGDRYRGPFDVLRRDHRRQARDRTRPRVSTSGP